MSVAIDLQPGDEFAGHRIEAVAGRGGMGVVYRARQLDLDRLVALKLIAPSLSDDPRFRRRFIDESRTAASIDHPNVIPVYYAGDTDDRLYLAMRFVDGEDLRARIRRDGHLAPGAAAEVIAQVAAALDAAHARGLVHRDVKPGNVLLGQRDHVYLTDFGLTKRVDSASGATNASGWVGTLGYVSPEQIRGQRVDARSDVYALGCLLFYALTGAMPYQRDTDEATLWAHLNDPPPEVTQTVAGVPQAFEGVIARALAKDPDARFQSAGDLGRAALAAAGRTVPDAPERLVGIGPAAPAPVFDDETVVTPEHAPTRQATAALDARRRRTPPRLAPLLGAAVVVVAAVVVAVVLATSGSDPGQGGLPTTATTGRPDAPKPKPEAGHFVTNVGAGRANGLVSTRSRVWAVSSGSGRIALISTSSNLLAHHRPSIGLGGQAVTAGYGRVWIAKSNGSVIAYKISDQTRAGPPISLPGGGPVAIGVGGGAVWVGARRANNPEQPGLLYKIDPDTSTVVATITLPRGLQNLGVGSSGVWVIDGSRRAVRRVPFSSGRPGKTIPTGAGAYAVAVDGDLAWVTNQNDASVTRVNATTRATHNYAAGQGPQGIDATSKAVWVADSLSGRVTRLDPKTGRRVGSVKVGSQPFGVTIGGSTVWVSALASGQVARVDFD